LLLANLGVTQNQLGHRIRAAEYYRDSSKAYEALGEEQRAAQVQANAAALVIDYGSNPASGFRDMQNALSVSRKLGDKNFEVFCLQVIAAYYRYSGQHAEAERTLNQALAISRERNLDTHIAPLTMDIAKSHIEMADYETAKKLLLQALGDGKSPSAGEARLHLARVYIRTRDFTAAGQALAAASREIEGAGNASFVPLVREVSGELAYESGHLDEARTHFTAASALWIDEGPDAASVEARAYLGLLDGLKGRVDRGLAELHESLEQAQKMQRRAIELRCREFLARLAPRRPPA
jgi:tetratricopeptide (TPR) repeat protein